MKTILHTLFLLLGYSGIYGQITTPVIRANFGLDGDLRSNYFNDAFTISGGDDWFNYDASVPGNGLIDTTGVSAILAGYISDPDSRRLPFSRTMNVSPGTLLNNKLLIGAIFYRDYHGSDSTMYAAGSSKNGMSPGDWSCPVAQSIPDKNEILDVMAHMRRDGNTADDSLWLFGGISIEKTGGDRYIDYELYQTAIYYDRSTQKFYNYGPDAGHTSWLFDAAGNVTQVGDIIFTANYASAALTSLEARIWVSSTTWASTTPKDFNWSGSFDGAANGATYGYAGIVPKAAGDFYTGMVSSSSTWAGPFSLVRGDNSVVTDYTPGQFMEFSVNLTKLGIDSKTLLATVGCKTLFSRIFVKSRTSTSFTSQLKDFVAPVDIFHDFKAKASSDVIQLCEIIGPTAINVINPLPGFEYTWSTEDGHIVGSTTGNSILINSAGTYVATTKIEPGCPALATDTVVISPPDPNCSILESSLKEFVAVVSNREVLLSWSVVNNNNIKYFEVEGSTDGVRFYTLRKVYPQSSELPVAVYRVSDGSMVLKSNVLYYRVKIKSNANKISYSKTVQLSNDKNSAGGLKIFPNPVKGNMQISIFSPTEENIKLSIYDVAGRLMHTMSANLSKGNSILNITDFQSWPDGTYSIKVISSNNILVSKMVLIK